MEEMADEICPMRPRSHNEASEFMIDEQQMARAITNIIKKQSRIRGKKAKKASVLQRDDHFRLAAVIYLMD